MYCLRPCTIRDVWGGTSTETQPCGKSDIRPQNVPFPLLWRACFDSQRFLGPTARPVTSWHRPQPDRDAGSCRQTPRSTHWHCYSKSLGEWNEERVPSEIRPDQIQTHQVHHQKQRETSPAALHSPSTELGMSVGSHATLLKAEVCRELMRASSDTPPVQDRGPMWSTLHRISSLYMALGSWKVLVAALRSCFLREKTNLFVRCSSIQKKQHHHHEQHIKLNPLVIYTVTDGEVHTDNQSNSFIFHLWFDELSNQLLQEPRWVWHVLVQTRAVSLTH